MILKALVGKKKKTEAYNHVKCVTFLENGNIFQHGNKPWCQDSLPYVQLNSDSVGFIFFLSKARVYLELIL